MMAEVDRLFEQDPAEAGAPLQSNETAWVDSTTAECAYCGSFIRAEE